MASLYSSERQEAREGYAQTWRRPHSAPSGSRGSGLQAAVPAAPGPLHLPLPLRQEGAPAVLLLDAVVEREAAGYPHPQQRGGPPPVIRFSRLIVRSVVWPNHAPHLTLLVQGVAALLPALQLCPLVSTLVPYLTMPHCT